MSEQLFSNLRPDEIERLGLLAEEAAEVIQVVGKILRHGWDSTKPSDPNGPTNRENLVTELVDLSTIIGLCEGCGDFNISGVINEMGAKKIEKLKRYTHHQKFVED